VEKMLAESLLVAVSFYTFLPTPTPDKTRSCLFFRAGNVWDCIFFSDLPGRHSPGSYQRMSREKRVEITTTTGFVWKDRLVDDIEITGHGSSGRVRISGANNDGDTISNDNNPSLSWH
jgi:hypothetical protein